MNENYQYNNFQVNNINDNNNVNSSKDKKSKKFILIILLIAIIIFVLIVVSIANKKSTNSNNDSNHNSSQNSSETIKFIQISDEKDIYAVTSNNDLYAIGSNSYNQLSNESNVNDKLILVQNNIKSFYATPSQTYYIDNDDNLYVRGLHFSGGAYEVFEKIAENVKDISSYFNCTLIIDSNNQFQIRGKHSKFCGITDPYEDFTTIANNVKSIISMYYISGYVSAENELFIKTNTSDSYSKVLDNVKEVSNYLVLTNDNNVYKINYINGKLELLNSNVRDINKKYYITSDNSIYNGEKNEKIIFSDLEINDLNKLLYYGSTTNSTNRCTNLPEAIVYINNNNELVFHTEKENLTYKKDLAGIEKIYEHLRNTCYQQQT